MEIWELDKLIIFIMFVIPGFISLKFFGLFNANNTKDSSKLLIDAIAYSSLNYAILFIPILYIESSSIFEEYKLLYYFFYFFVLFIFPILWVWIWSTIRKSDILQNITPHPTEQAWDYIFSQRKSYWLKITLKNGKILCGKYSENSFSSSSSHNDIFLEESWIINKKGWFKRAKNDTSGILILKDEISFIEFFQYN
ncbi:DUF6338 family protein [Aliarcobacter butzleri]|uniref:DUF6338 family protein n=1 Tax=Aliarcobacter butzleri TaxID=28197 RepID=UPI00263ED8BA|nr:DUF6338 family protein [Aliarcobacter butzleri]MDN5043127.1 DUF6338 family protein [Aliarcobacter butzleri]